jgi:hypothetical protein
MSFCAGSTVAQFQLKGDLNSDHVVDFRDLRTFAWQWLEPGCLVTGCIGDLDGADGVNMADFALLAKNWQVKEAHLVISEFMASNASQVPLEDGELLDGDGESSDWIELYNPTDTAIILDGWYLTDNDSNLTKWQFPDGLEVKAGEFLIVFASDKTYELCPHNYPYRDAGGHYHTNFNLDKEGEYLALVAPGGTIVVHEYAPEYPAQLPNISYGLAQHATTLVPTRTTVSYYVPNSNDAGVDWTAVGFNDSGWDTGKTGLGFGSVVDTGVVALYKFNGDCSDSTGSHDGTHYPGAPTFVSGKFDEAIDLDGGGKYVETGKTASTLGLNGNAARTITAWVYTRSFNDGGIFEMGAHSDAQDFSLRTNMMFGDN